jgi:protein required for attachment to host cells
MRLTPINAQIWRLQETVSNPKKEALLKPTITWICLADGNESRILVHEGPAKGLSELDKKHGQQEPKSQADIMADKPGRSFASAGDRRAAMEPHTDPVELLETEFLKSLAADLDQEAENSRFDRLIVIAAPEALGTLRKAYTPRVKALLYAEIDKNLTNTPLADMPKHLEDVMRV